MNDSTFATSYNQTKLLLRIKLIVGPNLGAEKLETEKAASDKSITANTRKKFSCFFRHSRERAQERAKLMRDDRFIAVDHLVFSYYLRLTFV